MPAQATTAITPGAKESDRRVDRWFYIGAALFVILLSVVGFGPSMIDRAGRNGPPTLLVIAHGLVAAGWLLLFLVQATLVATRRTSVHRRLGLVGPLLAVLLLVLGYPTAIENARRGYDLSGDLSRAAGPPGSPPPTADELRAKVVGPLAGFLDFGVLVAVGLWYRRRPDIHKRCMLLALAPLATVPLFHLVGHLTGSWPALRVTFRMMAQAIAILLFLSSAIYDKVSQGRIHQVSLWIPILFLASQIVIGAVVQPSVAWHEFAAWMFR
jgi:hypothetical protein